MPRRHHPDGPVSPAAPSAGHVGTELGRRCQSLHDAAANLTTQIIASIDPSNPLSERAGPNVRAVFAKLCAHPSFRILLAELSAFEGYVRHADPQLFDALARPPADEPPGYTEVPRG